MGHMEEGANVELEIIAQSPAIFSDGTDDTKYEDMYEALKTYGLGCHGD